MENVSKLYRRSDTSGQLNEYCGLDRDHMRGLFLCGHHFGFVESGKLRIASSTVRSSECQGISVSVACRIMFMSSTLRRPVEHLWLAKMKQTQ